MDCVFCKIVNGDIPSFKVWEDKDHLAFLSIAPIIPGHTLVVPKKHSEYIFDIEDEDLGNFIKTCKPVAQILKDKIHPKTGKIGIMVAGLEVSHTHIHLVPMDSEGDLTFANAKQADSEDLKIILEKIQSVS